MKNILNNTLVLLLAAGALFACPFRTDAAPRSHDASALSWRLWAYRPNVWRMNFDFARLQGNWSEVDGIPFTVPGSVQKALLDAGLVEDWNIGVNSPKAEWIENRHWIVATPLPAGWIRAAAGEQVILHCEGLDYKGFVMVNGREAGHFDNAFLPYRFDLTPCLREDGNTLAFVFECPPENLAQIGWTSRIHDWKPRFNFGWDWVPRIVQTGIWDDVRITVEDPARPRLKDVHWTAGADDRKDEGCLSVEVEREGPAAGTRLSVSLADVAGKILIRETLPAGKTSARWEKLKIRRWWPNGTGQQPLYTATVRLLDADGTELDRNEHRIGFRTLTWTACEGAAPEADPWLCQVNGTPVFIQGVDWTPIRPNFADLHEEDYRRLIDCYRSLGINAIRVWGGGFAEKNWLYDLCDEAGILVWQDFPLSSSGLENYPPTEEKTVGEMACIAEHYIRRLRNHPCLLLWCGGNELYERGDTAPITDRHPMAARQKEKVLLLDPLRRFVPGTPSGPVINTLLNHFGKGISYDVHGPWNLPYTATDQTMAAVEDFWSRCDALFLSEVGVPGAASLQEIEKYRGNCDVLPASETNPLWKSVNWWIQWDEYLAKGGDPADAAAYVAWSQQRQTEGLVTALRRNKARFPACGGFVIWMGHDCFPCPVNTSVIDFDGNLKPVARELEKIWKTAPEDL